jgi:hypothetical protein
VLQPAFFIDKTKWSTILDLAVVGHDLMFGILKSKIKKFFPATMGGPVTNPLFRGPSPLENPIFRKNIEIEFFT